MINFTYNRESIFNNVEGDWEEKEGRTLSMFASISGYVSDRESAVRLANSVTKISGDFSLKSCCAMKSAFRRIRLTLELKSNIG